MGATTFFLLEKERREKAEKEKQAAEKKKVEVKTFKPDKKEKEIDFEKEVEKYHTGRGWYELPDVEKNVRKEEAIEILKERDK